MQFIKAEQARHIQIVTVEGKHRENYKVCWIIFVDIRNNYDNCVVGSGPWGWMLYHVYQFMC